MTKLRNKISEYSKSDNNNYEKIVLESEKLLSWVSELDQIKSNLSEYQVSVQNNTIKEKINNLIELKELLQEIESMDEIGSYYFNDNWELHNSNVGKLKEQLNNIQEFKKQYDANYFNDITLEFIESNNFNTLEKYLNELSDVKTKIKKQYDEINSRLHFKMN